MVVVNSLKSKICGTLFEEMPESSGSQEGEGGSGGGGSSRFARLLPPTHIQKVGTRLELEVEARQNTADGDGGPVSSVIDIYAYILLHQPPTLSTCL